MTALGVEPRVAERCLNHRLDCGVGVHNRCGQFQQRRRTLEAWGQLLPRLPVAPMEASLQAASAVRRALQQSAKAWRRLADQPGAKDRVASKC